MERIHYFLILVVSLSCLGVGVQSKPAPAAYFYYHPDPVIEPNNETNLVPPVFVSDSEGVMNDQHSGNSLEYVHPPLIVPDPVDAPTTTTTTTTTETPDTTTPKPDVSIIVFASTNFGGLRNEVTLKANETCRNLERNWRQRASSIDTKGNCIQLCERRRCEGSCIQVQPGSPYHNRLRNLNFDKKLSSLKHC